MKIMIAIFPIQNRHNQNMFVTLNPVADAKAFAIIQHGYPSSSKCIPVQSMIAGFNALGITTAAIDTTSNDNDSDGELNEMTLSGHCNDLEDAVRKLTSVNSSNLPVILAGHSAGAHSALCVSQKIEKPPLLTLAVSPLISGEAYLRAWETKAETKSAGFGEKFMKRWEERGTTPYISDSTGEKLALPWSVMKDWKEHSLFNKTTPNSDRSIMIYGDKDELTPPADIIHYTERSGITSVFAVKGADHSFQDHRTELTTQVRHIVHDALMRLGV